MYCSLLCLGILLDALVDLKAFHIQNFDSKYKLNQVFDIVDRHF